MNVLNVKTHKEKVRKGGDWGGKSWKYFCWYKQKLIVDMFPELGSNILRDDEWVMIASLPCSISCWHAAQVPEISLTRDYSSACSWYADAWLWLVTHWLTESPFFQDNARMMGEDRCITHKLSPSLFFFVSAEGRVGGCGDCVQGELEGDLITHLSCCFVTLHGRGKRRLDLNCVVLTAK